MWIIQDIKKGFKVNSQYEEILRQGFFTYRGRVALSLILRSMQVGAGDEVILQAYTCEAVPEAIIAVGATPVYADISHQTLSLTPLTLAPLVSNRTKAIIYQHTFGIPSEYTAEIAKIAKKQNIPLIEDCCHSVFESNKINKIGTYAVASFFSFEWGKPVVGGLGGALVVNDDKLLDIVRENYEKMIQPSTPITAPLEFLAFTLTNFTSLRSIVKKLYSYAVKYKLIRGNFNKLELDFSEHNLKITPFNKWVLLPKLKNRKSTNKPYNFAVNEWLLPWLIQPLILGPQTVFRVPLYFNDKTKAFNLAKNMGLDVCEWYVSPVHPSIMKKELLQWGYNNKCENAELASKQVIHFKFHTSQKNIKKMEKFVRKCVQYNIIISPPRSL